MQQTQEFDWRPSTPSSMSYHDVSPHSVSKETSRWDARQQHVVPHTNSYYAKCMAGGVLSSSIRMPLVPLDVVKVKMQVAPTQFPSIRSGLMILWNQDGARSLFRGLGPTALAYATQTGTKYGAYEVFKDQFSTLAGRENAEHYKGLIYVVSAGTAEACADVLMCPFEQLKIKVQTSSGKTFPKSTLGGLWTMMQDPKKYRFPFGSLGPLMGRQIPSTIANFYVFENVVDAVYTHALPGTRDDYNLQLQLGVTLFAGYVAGFVSAVVSHPADTLVSLMSLPENRGKPLRQLIQEKGAIKLATAGLGPRVLMTGSIIGFQWWIYDSFKTAVGLGTSGGRH